MSKVPMAESMEKIRVLSAINQPDFERKSALFSLAVAEVLIVNMWEHMVISTIIPKVGLYNGANMGLLKTVFEVNLQLFQKDSSPNSPKTCLLFVFRDFTNQTSIENLAQTLISDLNKIWDSLPKPSGKEESKITGLKIFPKFRLLRLRLPRTFPQNLRISKL